MDTNGKHLIMELSGCREDILKDGDKVKNILTEASRIAHAEVREVIVYGFHPCGISVMVILSESHLSVHTWPLLKYASVDIYTCGDKTRPESACEFIYKEFEAHTKTITALQRGIPTKQGTFTHNIMSYAFYYQNPDFMPIPPDPETSLP